jgi:NAD(P)-dependent dehydrogenase (short-subunit alcohol dehydrogenase family)
MKVAITGHTRGIGQEIANFFQEQGAEIVGFSKSTGFDISQQSVREQIIEQAQDCDIFVNNAFVADEENSQLLMLRMIISKWTNKDKTIINISSRASDSVNDPIFPFPKYARAKYKLDQLCLPPSMFPYIINLKPGTIDTDMTRSRMVRKMQTSSITKVLKFILDNKEDFKVRSITFTP